MSYSAFSNCMIVVGTTKALLHKAMITATNSRMRKRLGTVLRKGVLLF